jgi:hypothetical protein
VSSVKGPWEKAEILSKAALPVVVALLGFFISRTLDKNRAAEADTRLNTQLRDSDSRLYTELVTKREESDTSLRQSMFESVLRTFLASRPGSSDKDILNLELLALNFHETLNLKSLFVHVEQQVSSSKQQQDRLIDLAKQVSKMETDALAPSGATAKLEFYPIDGQIPFRKGPWVSFVEGLVSNQGRESFLRYPNQRNGSNQPTPPELVPAKDQRYFSVHLVDVPSRRQVRLQLQVYAPGAKTILEVSSTFDHGYFDFPMVENIRLSQGQRCAAVLTELSEVVITVELIFFPGSHASLKDKPYYDEVLEGLHNFKAR